LLLGLIRDEFLRSPLSDRAGSDGEALSIIAEMPSCEYGGGGYSCRKSTEVHECGTFAGGDCLALEQDKSSGEGIMPLEYVEGPVAELHVDDGGAGGVPVVFVHSFAGSASHWKAQLAYLRKNRRAVAFDLRGHGKSASPKDGDYAIASLTSDIATVVDKLGLGRFVLVGHSVGGAAAIAYAGAHPRRVAGLVLAGAPGKVPRDQAQKVMSAIEADYDNAMRPYWEKLLTGAKPDVRAKIEREMNTISKEATLKIIRAAFEFDPVPPLEHYPGPKLVLYTASGDTPNDLRNLVPNVPHRRIESTSHWMQMDEPEEFNQMLDAFLATVR
jgi:pimeloyl-ACP methyl ester carboxylesterase